MAASTSIIRAQDPSWLRRDGTPAISVTCSSARAMQAAYLRKEGSETNEERKREDARVHTVLPRSPNVRTPVCMFALCKRD